MIRLFAALPLPEHVRTRLQMLQSGIQGARWVKPENFHLTLRFIGGVEHGLADDIDTALAGVTIPQFSLSLSNVGFFGKTEKARILWAGVDNQPMLTRLQAKVEQSLQRVGLPPETHRFTPHVTLARLKNARPAHVTSFVEDNAAFKTSVFPIDRFVLYSSFLSQSGAIYTPEVEYRLEPMPDDES